MKPKIEIMLTNSLLFRALRLLERRDKLKLVAVTVLQILMGLLDLISVALIGLLSAIAVNGIQSKSTTSSFLDRIPLFDLNELTFQQRVGILGISAAFLMILRTCLSIIISRRILFFLSRRGAQISSSLISKVLGQSLTLVQKHSTQQVVYAVTSGVTAITLGIIGSSAALIADSSLLIFMTIGLFSYDPLMAVITAFIFAGIGYILYLFMHLRIKALGEKSAELAISSNQQIIEVLSSFRESFVRNRRAHYANNISSVRRELADASAEMSFMPNISKYVLEIALVIGAITIAASQFLTRDAISAISSMTIFMAASTRIAPAVLRIQQGVLGIKGSAGSAKPTLQLIEEVMLSPELPFDNSKIDFDHLGFSPRITIENLDFTYNRDAVLHGINAEFIEGQKIAVIGNSGAGKSTLMDLLIGVLSPEKGAISISGMQPIEAIKRWQGAIAYVPQTIALTEGTIAENIRLGFSTDVIPDDRLRQALKSAELLDFVNSLPEGIHTPIGENGSRLSGGQKQRIGIARALVTNPKLIFMDEATSALDHETEEKISQTISKLGDSVSVILIAHRVTTIQHADKILYLEAGRVRSFGNINHVRKEVKSFESMMNSVNSQKNS